MQNDWVCVLHCKVLFCFCLVQCSVRICPNPLSPSPYGVKFLTLGVATSQMYKSPGESWHFCLINSEAREWRHDSDKQTVEWWMILKVSLRDTAGAPKRLVKRKLRQHSLYLPQNKLMLTESRGEFSDLHSIFRLRGLRYFERKIFSSEIC